MRYKITFLIICILTLSSCKFNNQEYTYTGTIESNQVDVISESVGKITKLYFDEGQMVNQNDLIAETDNTMQNLQLDIANNTLRQAQARYDEIIKGNRVENIRVAKANYDSAKSRLADIESGSRYEQVMQAKLQIEQATSSVSALQSNYDNKKNNYENILELFKSASTSQKLVDDAKLQLDDALSKFEISKKSLESANAGLELLENGSTENTIEAAKAQVEAAKAAYDLLINGNTKEAINQIQASVDIAKAGVRIAIENLSKTKILSPISGIISTQNFKQGEMVFAGSNIASITNKDDLWVKVYILQKDINTVKIDKEVILKSPSDLSENIKGKIVYISPEAEFTPKNTQTKEGKENTVFEVKIKIMDGFGELRPGMIVDTNL